MEEISHFGWWTLVSNDNLAGERMACNFSAEDLILRDADEYYPHARIDIWRQQGERPEQGVVAYIFAKASRIDDDSVLRLRRTEVFRFRAPCRLAKFAKVNTTAAR